jgi:hypothetical protein
MPPAPIITGVTVRSAAAFVLSATSKMRVAASAMRAAPLPLIVEPSGLFVARNVTLPFSVSVPVEPMFTLFTAVAPPVPPKVSEAKTPPLPFRSRTASPLLVASTITALVVLIALATPKVSLPPLTVVVPVFAPATLRRRVPAPVFMRPPAPVVRTFSVRSCIALALSSTMKVRVPVIASEAVPVPVIVEPSGSPAAR